MNVTVSPHTQAILLLTAPLISGGAKSSSTGVSPLSQGAYKRFARLLRDQRLELGDLLAPNALETLREFNDLIDCERIQRLLDRGFLLCQAIERWQARSIWVVSRSDPDYPELLKMRLAENAPPVLYGCGDTAILNTGGLAVVGSRQVDASLIEYTVGVGELAAHSGRTLVSGGARGVDQAAMRGALEAGGRAAGMLADKLERAALQREHRDVLMEGRLVLASPYDPLAGFHVGQAMQRNKLIYALADAALVVNAEYGTGGTWSGAVEQLEKLRFAPVFVRSNGAVGDGLEGLLSRGALPWPDPATPEALEETLASARASQATPEQDDLFSLASEKRGAVDSSIDPSVQRDTANDPFALARESALNKKTPVTETEFASECGVSKKQAKAWLRRLVEEGELIKYTKPVRYGPKSQSSLLE